jgi:hypothetical protein
MCFECVAHPLKAAMCRMGKLINEYYPRSRDRCLHSDFSSLQDRVSMTLADLQGTRIDLRVARDELKQSKADNKKLLVDMATQRLTYQRKIAKLQREKRALVAQLSDSTIAKAKDETPLYPAARRQPA